MIECYHPRKSPTWHLLLHPFNPRNEVLTFSMNWFSFTLYVNASITGSWNKKYHHFIYGILTTNKINPFQEKNIRLFNWQRTDWTEYKSHLNTYQSSAKLPFQFTVLSNIQNQKSRYFRSFNIIHRRKTKSFSLPCKFPHIQWPQEETPQWQWDFSMIY